MLSQFRTLHLRVASSRLDFRIDILKIDPTALRRPSGRRRGRYMTIRECAFYVFESRVNYSLHISEFLGRREPYYCPANVVLDAVKKCYYFNRNGHGFIRCRKSAAAQGSKSWGSRGSKMRPKIGIFGFYCIFMWQFLKAGGAIAPPAPLVARPLLL